LPDPPPATEISPPKEEVGVVGVDGRDGDRCASEVVVVVLNGLSVGVGLTRFPDLELDALEDAIILACTVDVVAHLFVIGFFAEGSGNSSSRIASSSGTTSRGEGTFDDLGGGPAESGIVVVALGTLVAIEPTAPDASMALGVDPGLPGAIGSAVLAICPVSPPPGGAPPPLAGGPLRPFSICAFGSDIAPKNPDLY
jgi:hypothetical protein